MREMQLRRYIYIHKSVSINVTVGFTFGVIQNPGEKDRNGILLGFNSGPEERKKEK